MLAAGTWVEADCPEVLPAWQGVKLWDGRLGCH
jgi:hypothetical protein